MNYQPFLEMNLLVSDELIEALTLIKFPLISLLVVTFYLLMFLHISLFQLFALFYLRRTMRQRRKRHYPQHNIT